jgi:hypothetical protein
VAYSTRFSLKGKSAAGHNCDDLAAILHRFDGQCKKSSVQVDRFNTSLPQHYPVI